MSVPGSCLGGVSGFDSLRGDGTRDIVYFCACALPFRWSHYGLVFPFGFVCFDTPLVNRMKNMSFSVTSTMPLVNQNSAEFCPLTLRNSLGFRMPLAAGIKVFYSLH